ncbi:hypothetical protein ACFLRH_02220 [Actinomycetota bacterium]
MQGRLRSEKLTAVIDTECAHCDVPIRLEVDSNLDFRARTEGAAPLVCTPFVNVAELTPSIIDGF